MSKVSKQIVDTLKDWREQGIPKWKFEQLVRDCLVRFKETQWENSVIAQQLTDKDKPEFDEAFEKRFPMHAAAVSEYTQKFEAGRAFDKVKGLAFESPEQVQEYLDILADAMPEVYRVVNKIVGVPAFSVAPAAESGDTETAEDLGLQP